MTGEPRYFLTAYGIALKHGFQGSEEEWLESITAYGQALSAGFEGNYEQWLQKIADPVPELTVGETITIEAGLPARVEISGAKEYPIFSFYIPRGAGMEDALLRTGDTMSGIFNMNGFPLIGLPDPAADDEAVNKKYVDSIDRKNAEAANNAQKAAGEAKKVADAALPRTGAVMEGSIDMNGFGIANLPAPETDGSAVNRFYVDGKRKLFSVTLLAANWNGEGPYTQTVAVEGILSTDMPHYSAVYSADPEVRLDQKESFAMVDDLYTESDRVTFACFEERPGVDLSIQMEVFR